MNEEAVESTSAEGQPTGDPEAGGQATASQTGGEPTGVEGLPEDWTPDTIADRHKDYTSLQSEFTKRNQAFNELNSKFDRFGGADQLLQWAEYLDTNPKFAEWVESQKQQETLGTSLDDLDEDTKQAIELVQRMSKSEVDRLYQEKVAPIENSLKERQLQNTMNELGEKYGEKFDQMRDTMAELAADLPLEIQDNPSAEVLDDLFWKAMRKTGEFDKYAADVYKKQLEATKAKSMDKPTQKLNTTKQTKPMTVTEAFELAKQAAAG